MSRGYNYKTYRAPAPMTDQEVLRIARKKGKFEVSLKWRFDALRRQCVRLKKAGLLTGGRRIDRANVFYPAAVVTPIPNQLQGKKATLIIADDVEIQAITSSAGPGPDPRIHADIDQGGYYGD